MSTFKVKFAPKCGAWCRGAVTTLHYIEAGREINNLTTKSVCLPHTGSSSLLHSVPVTPRVPGGIFSGQKARVTGPATITRPDRQISARPPASQHHLVCREHQVFHNRDDFKHQPPGRLFLGSDKDYKYHNLLLKRLYSEILTVYLLLSALPCCPA